MLFFDMFALFVNYKKQKKTVHINGHVHITNRASSSMHESNVHTCCAL